MSVVRKTMLQSKKLYFSPSTGNFHGPDIGMNLTGKSIVYVNKENEQKDSKHAVPAC